MEANVNAETVYKKGENEFADREFAAASQYGKVKLADKMIFWKKGLRWYGIGLECVERAFRRIETVNAKLCCGKVNFDIQKLVLILKDSTELELLVGEGTPKEAELLFEKFREKNAETGILFGKA